MSKTRRGQRKSGADNYPTPDWPIRRFLEKWEDLGVVGDRWLEPCAGDGVIIDVVNEYRRGIQWTACDIRDTGHSIRRVDLGPGGAFHHGDFRTLDVFDPEHLVNGHKLKHGQRPWDVAIMNPPFRLTMDFLSRCLLLADVVVLLQRINYCGSEKRHDFFQGNLPDRYEIPNRISFTGDGKADGLEHAWHVWGPHPRGRHVAEWRLLDHTPLEERKRSYRRIVQARDERAVTLDAIFAESLPS